MIRPRFLPAVCLSPDAPGYTLEEALASVGAGWWPLVRDGMAAAARADARVVQVKEKFGVLRLHAHSPDDTPLAPQAWAALRDVLVAVEARSKRACERCGAEAPAGPRRSPTAGWIKTVCDACLPLDVRAWDPTCAGNFRQLPAEWFEDPRDHEAGPRWRHLEFGGDPEEPWAPPPWAPSEPSWEATQEDPDA
jgi:hypothetical protein